MSEKVSKAYIKKLYGMPIVIRQCEIQSLLSGMHEDYYSLRAEGWACDYKYFPGISKVLCYGNDPIGRQIKDYSIVEKYEKKAIEEDRKFNNNEGIYFISDDIKNDSYMYPFEIKKMALILRDQKDRLLEDLLLHVELI